MVPFENPIIILVYINPVFSLKQSGNAKASLKVTYGSGLSRGVGSSKCRAWFNPGWHAQMGSWMYNQSPYCARCCAAFGNLPPQAPNGQKWLPWKQYRSAHDDVMISWHHCQITSRCCATLTWPSEWKIKTKQGHGSQRICPSIWGSSVVIEKSRIQREKCMIIFKRLRFHTKNERKPQMCCKINAGNDMLDNNVSRYACMIWVFSGFTMGNIKLVYPKWVNCVSCLRKDKEGNCPSWCLFSSNSNH